MKIWTKMLALVMVLGLAGVAQAKEKKKDKGGAGVRGKITAVTDDSITIDSSTKNAAGESHTYKIAGATISINGELKTAADLKTETGKQASIKASGDKATAITVTGKATKKKKAA